MLADMSDFMTYPDKDFQKKKVCESLPIFTYNKNCSLGSYDRNKLLMIDPYMLDTTWESDYKKLKQQCSMIKF